MNLLEVLPDGMFQEIPTVKGAVGRILRPQGTFPMYPIGKPYVFDNHEKYYDGVAINPIVSQRVTYSFFPGENPFHMFYVRCYIRDGNRQPTKFGGTLHQFFNATAKKQDFYEHLIKMVADERVFTQLDIECNKCDKGTYTIGKDLRVGCNRCSGRGWQSVSDQWKNAYYDADMRRKIAMYPDYPHVEHWFPDDRVAHLESKNKPS